MKKNLFFLLAMIFCTLLSSCFFITKESPAEDFTYEIKDGEVIITGYIGTDREIYIPKEIASRPVTTIGEEAFEEYDLTFISIPQSITEIESRAFSDCACLEKIQFSNGLMSIGSYAFSDCEALVELEFPNTLKEIQQGAFSYCSKLEKVNFPLGLEALHYDAFGDCENLKRLRVPNETNLQLYTTEQSVSSVGFTVVQFFSPVGRTAAYYGHPTLSSEYGTLPTVLVVSSGSYAHQQVQEYARYGLQYEVE